jgi:hypothetical protein
MAIFNSYFDITRGYLWFAQPLLQHPMALFLGPSNCIEPIRVKTSGQKRAARAAIGNLKKTAMKPVIYRHLWGGIFLYILTIGRY